MIRSACFGQTFAHLQERKTEVFFTICGIVSCCCGRQRFGARQRGTMCTMWRKLLPRVVKNLSLALLKMGKSLPETCWADHWGSIKLLLLHFVGSYFTLPTLMMHGQTQIKYILPVCVLPWFRYRILFFLPNSIRRSVLVTSTQALFSGSYES